MKIKLKQKIKRKMNQIYIKILKNKEEINEIVKKVKFNEDF